MCSLGVIWRARGCEPYKQGENLWEKTKYCVCVCVCYAIPANLRAYSLLNNKTLL